MLVGGQLVHAPLPPHVRPQISLEAGVLGARVTHDLPASDPFTVDLVDITDGKGGVIFPEAHLAYVFIGSAGDVEKRVLKGSDFHTCPGGR